MTSDANGGTAEEAVRRKRILIVDDEVFVREAGCAMLDMLGFQAEAVASAEQALQTLQDDSAQYDLVLIDLNMPGMQGDECFCAMKAINPELHAAIISGSITNDSRIRALLPHGLLGVIQKPFTMDSLTRHLAEFLPEQ